MSKSGSWINNHLFTYTPYSTCRAVMQILQQIGRHMDALERQILAVKTQLTEIIETVDIMPKRNDKNIN